jgi:hypothetical protein
VAASSGTVDLIFEPFQNMIEVASVITALAPNVQRFDWKLTEAASGVNFSTTWFFANMQILQFLRRMTELTIKRYVVTLLRLYQY